MKNTRYMREIFDLKKGKVFLITIVANISIILFAYRQLWETFYMQDEWFGFGLSKVYGLEKFLFGGLSLPEIILARRRILAGIINYTFYKFFPLEIAPFVVFALFLHIFNSILVFVLTRKITKNNLIAFISSIFFAVVSVSKQAVIWPAASTSSLPAATFVLLSLILYIEYLAGNQRKFIYLSQVSAVISIYFKESGMFLFLFLPIFYFIYSNKSKCSAKELLKLHGIFFIFGAVLVGFRFYNLHSMGQRAGGLFVTSSKVGMVSKIALHAILYPLTSLSQIFIPSDVMFRIAREFTGIQYPFLENIPRIVLINQSVVSDMLSIFFSFLILFLAELIFRKSKFRKTFVFAVVFIFMSTLPFIILDRGNTYLDSRYFYLPVIGGGILLGLFIQSFKKWRFLAMLLLLPYLFWQVTLTQGKVTMEAEKARERKKFISQLKEYSEKLPNKPVFYITGDDDYIVENNKAPFQQGIGYTLMVIYYDTGLIPAKLIQKSYLWDLMDQGYEKVGGKGFGFFWSKPELLKEINEKKSLFPQQIVGFYYFGGDKQKLIDITAEIRS